MVGTDEEKKTTMLISLSAASQYALFLLERTGARALRKSGQYLARTSYIDARTIADSVGCMTRGDRHYIFFTREPFSTTDEA